MKTTRARDLTPGTRIHAFGQTLEITEVHKFDRIDIPLSRQYFPACVLLIFRDHNELSLSVDPNERLRIVEGN